MLVGIACKALKGAGLSEDAKEMKCEIAHALRTPCHKVFVSKYDVDTEE